MNAYELADTIEEEIKAGFGMGFMPHAIKMLRQLQADNIELKEYNTELHGIEHDLEMKVSKLQVEIAELKNARDYWCLQYKDVFNKLETKCNGK